MKSTATLTCCLFQDLYINIYIYIDVCILDQLLTGAWDNKYLLTSNTIIKYNLFQNNYVMYIYISVSMLKQLLTSSWIKLWVNNSFGLHFGRCCNDVSDCFGWRPDD